MLRIFSTSPAVPPWHRRGYGGAGTDPSPDPARPNTFPLLGAHVHGNLFFSACMMIFSLIGSALLITA